MDCEWDLNGILLGSSWDFTGVDAHVNISLTLELNSQGSTVLEYYMILYGNSFGPAQSALTLPLQHFKETLSNLVTPTYSVQNVS